jgi:hypothetical protein
MKGGLTSGWKADVETVKLGVAMNDLCHDVESLGRPLGEATVVYVFYVCTGWYRQT